MQLYCEGLRGLVEKINDETTSCRPNNTVDRSEVVKKFTLTWLRKLDIKY